MSDAAITTIVSGTVTVVTMVVGFLTLWVKLKYGVQKVEEAATKAQVVEKKIDEAASKTEVVEKKLDANTIITREGNKAAISNARNAANVANEAKQVVDSISKRLNGGIDSALEEYLAPVHKRLDEHGVKIQEIGAKLEELVTLKKQQMEGK